MKVLKELYIATTTPNSVISKQTTTVIFCLWLVSTLLVWSFGPSTLIPRPGETISAFGRLVASEGLLLELKSSLFTNIEVLVIATIITLFFSYLTVLPIMRPSAWMISKFRFLGLTGLTFLFTVLVGGGHTLKVSLMVFGVTVFFVTGMSAVIKGIPKEKYDHARTLGMSEWEVVYEVVVVGQLDQVFEMLRQSAAIGWMMLTMVEGLVRSEGGLGAMLLNENKHLNLDAVFAIQLTILFIGLSKDYLIGVIKNVVCPYAQLTLERS